MTRCDHPVRRCRPFGGTCGGLTLPILAWVLLWLATAIFHSSPASAAQSASDWADGEHSSVRLISAARTVADGNQVMLGLEFKMKSGWKIYWRSPGDAGYPPKPVWTGSDNLKSAKMRWPVPSRFSVLGFESLGYKNHVILPVDATLSQPGAPLRLRAAVDYLTCNEICVPMQAALALDLPTGPPMPSEHAREMNRFASLVPGTGARLGLTVERAELLGEGKIQTLRVHLTSAVRLTDPDLFIEGPEGYVFTSPEIEIRGTGRKAILESAADGRFADALLTGQTVALTLVDGPRAIEQRIVVVAAPADAPPPIKDVPTANQIDEPPEPLSFWAILGLSLIGGLILNLMPCVLPVLSIKMFGVISHGGKERKEIRKGFLASSAGIIFAFLVLAAVLSALKSGGAAVGWGIQFQQSWFLVGMTVLVSLFAFNLFGLFEIFLPQWVSSADEKVGHLHGLGGHFVSGMFATLLATPCSAPVLGTAVGFALSRGTMEIHAVFLVLGIGLAAPYLAVAAFPGLAKRMPKPGRWMVRLRMVLGLALVGTAVWLLSVLMIQVGMQAAVALGLLMTVMGGMFWALPRLGTKLTAMAVVSLVVASFAVPTVFGETNIDLSVDIHDEIWVDFDRQQIPVLVAQGKTVFVDVTAEWCITCQVNKKFVLMVGESYERLIGENVVAMRADWTLPSDAISEYLAAFGRYGIPFNVVYGPGAPRGIALPELLTTNDIISAMDKAAG